MPLRPSDISPDVVRALNAGTREAANLAESLAVDFARLLKAVAPDLPAASFKHMKDGAGLGVTRRMALAAALVYEAEGEAAFDRLAGHASDTARGWACYVLGMLPGLTIAARLARVRPLAADANPGVREWAWIGLRSHVVAAPSAVIAALAPWTENADANVRRFASEATRPRGVWAAHVRALRDDPAPGLAVLEPMRADPAKYVQDSVANWLNDAAKDHPAWVEGVCARWIKESPGPATARIARRAQRSLTL